MYLHAFGTYIIREKANEYIDSSMFHRAFFNSIMDKTPTHALSYSTLY